MLKSTVPLSNVIWTGSTTMAGPQQTSQWLVPKCDHHPEPRCGWEALDDFGLTHCQSSQQETISKLPLMQHLSIYVPG